MIRLFRSSSRWVFCSLPASSSVLSPPSFVDVPLLVCTHLSVASPSIYWFISFTFICFSLASALSSLVLFILPSSVHLLSASLPFPGLCTLLSRSLPVHPASLFFFHGGFLVRVSDFDPYFLVQSLRPRLLSFFGSVFLSCTFETLQFFCPASFFFTVQPFPVLVFHTSSSASSWVYCVVFASLQS